MRLVANWMDSEIASAAQTTPVNHLDSLLPLMDLQSMTDDTFINFMGENYALVTNHQYR